MKKVMEMKNTNANQAANQLEASISIKDKTMKHVTKWTILISLTFLAVFLASCSTTQLPQELEPVSPAGSHTFFYRHSDGLAAFGVFTRVTLVN